MINKDGSFTPIFHRGIIPPIDDNGSGDRTLWSANKIQEKLDEKFDKPESSIEDDLYLSTENGQAVWKKIEYNDKSVSDAKKLSNPRTISVSGIVSGEAQFDGSGDIDIPLDMDESYGLTNAELEELLK